MVEDGLIHLGTGAGSSAPAVDLGLVLERSTGAANSENEGSVGMFFQEQTDKFVFGNLANAAAASGALTGSGNIAANVANTGSSITLEAAGTIAAGNTLIFASGAGYFPLSNKIATWNAATKVATFTVAYSTFPAASVATAYTVRSGYEPATNVLNPSSYSDVVCKNLYLNDSAGVTTTETNCWRIEADGTSLKFMYNNVMQFGLDANV